MEPAPSSPQNAPSLGFSDSLEAALRALLQPEAVFSGLRQAPAPAWGPMLLQFLFWMGLSCLLSVVLLLVNQPSAAMGAIPLAVGLGAALAAMIPLSFLSAGILHVLALLSGGSGGFGRSYQILSCVASLAPVAAVALWLPVPWIWLLPSLYGTYLFVRAVELIHQAPAVQAWLVVGVIGGLLTFGEFLFQQKAASLGRSMENMATIYSSAPAGGAGPAAIPAVGQALEQAASGPPVEPPPALGAVSSSLTQPLSEGASAGGGMPSMNMDNAMAQVRSSLQMISNDSGAGQLPAIPNPGGPAASPQSLEQMSQMSMNLLQMANKQMAANPHAFDNLPPDQRAQLRKLMQMANQMLPQTQKATSSRSSRQDRQQAYQQMMQIGASVGSAGPVDPSQPRPRTRRRPTVPDPDAVLGAD